MTEQAPNATPEQLTPPPAENTPSEEVHVSPTPEIPATSYAKKAAEFIIEALAMSGQVVGGQFLEDVSKYAREKDAQEKGIRVTLREKFGAIGRFGLLAGALSGCVPNMSAERLQVTAAAETGNAEATKYSMMTGRELSREEGLLQDAINAQVGTRPLFGLEQNQTLSVPEQGIERKDLPVAGFEGRPEAQATVEATLNALPASFLENINEVRYEDVEVPLGGEYGIKSLEAAHVDSRTRDIVLTKGSKNYSSFLTSGTLNHESCHLNAPDSHRALQPSQRYGLYESLLSRAQAPDRYQSSYVESINNADSQLELFRKADEYWAEVCEAYLNNDATLSGADRSLVESLLKITDPTFQEYSAAARQVRDQRLAELSNAKS